MLQSTPLILSRQQETRHILSEVDWVHMTVIYPNRPNVIPLQPIALRATS